MAGRAQGEGEERLRHDGEPRGHYYLDLRTSKTDSGLSGPLAALLTPVLDALILRGQDARPLLPLRRQTMTARAPVFPNTDGSPRKVRDLSGRWRARLGTGSIISRTRIHTLLGALGPEGVRAALALCAQRSPRTKVWYQAQALAATQVREGQQDLASLVKLVEDDVALLASLSRVVLIDEERSGVR